MAITRKLLNRSVSVGLIWLVVAALFPTAAHSTHAPKHPRRDQGLHASEMPAFRRSLKALLRNDNVDLVVSVRRMERPADGCRYDGRLVYWVHSTRGVICFVRIRSGRGWRFDVDIVSGRNPIARQRHTALATLAKERAASRRFLTDQDGESEDALPRNLIQANRITYPFAYERLVAEFDHPRTGDFVIVPDNTADRGSPGAHGHLDVTQSRTALIFAGRGARRRPLSAAAEAALKLKNVDIAPTVARALGVNSYFDDTGRPGLLLNGRPSEGVLLRRQDGRVLDQLLEPVFNTFLVVVDGLKPESVNPTLMPNLTGLLNENCVPGGTCAREYEEARAMMVTETNGNHVAMMTGAYGSRSGVFANNSWNRTTDEEIALDQPQLNFAETLFDRIERQKPWLRTASVLGKDKLRSLFDCTRTEAGACGPSDANPEGVTVEHELPDHVGGATTSPSDPDLDCPAEPGSGSGYTTNQCVMDVTIDLLRNEDPDFTFVNLPQVDAFSHLFGDDSVQAQEAVMDADQQIGRLVGALKESGKWQHSAIVVTADHNFGDTENPANTIYLNQVFDGIDEAAYGIVTHGGSASIYLTDLGSDDTPDQDQQALLAQMRAAALGAPGVTDAFYRLANPVDAAPLSTLEEAHPAWRLHGTDRVGELLLIADEQHAFAKVESDDDQVPLGDHGHPTDRHVPFVVLSGGTWVRDGVVAASDAINEPDDAGLLPEQAETADVAPTLAWLVGVGAPAQSQGRVLTDAFVKHPMKAHRDGTITEPIANRAAIFIFDQNNSVTWWCLVHPQTCGDPVPPQATDPAFAPTLEEIAREGLLFRYGSLSAWPSVTMPNHNTVGSGAYPGHHGLVNNRFYLRQEKIVEAPIDPQDPDNPLYIGTSDLLTGGVETLHEAVHRTFGDWEPGDGPASDKAYTASVDEPSARGADYATLEPTDSFPNPGQYIATQVAAEEAQDTSQDCLEVDPEGYGLESTLDHQGQTQARRLFDTHAGHPIPKYFINNFTLTDGAGHHFGPNTTCALASYRDSDRRLRRILDAIEASGVLGETLIVITGDHGGENQDLARRGLPGDFESYLDARRIDHVMTDWHVYLRTMTLSKEGGAFRQWVERSYTFTVRDHDTGEPIADVRVKVEGARGDVDGRTGEDGEVTLRFMPLKDKLRVVFDHAEFNRGWERYPVARSRIPA